MLNRAFWFAGWKCQGTDPEEGQEEEKEGETKAWWKHDQRQLDDGSWYHRGGRREHGRRTWKRRTTEEETQEKEEEEESNRGQRLRAPLFFLGEREFNDFWTLPFIKRMDNNIVHDSCSSFLILWCSLGVRMRSRVFWPIECWWAYIHRQGWTQRASGCNIHQLTLRLWICSFSWFYPWTL